MVARVAFAPALILSLAAGQQQTPLFRGGVELVTLDVVVIGTDGKPVGGLTADDFSVRFNGELRAVRAVDFLQFGANARVAAAAGETTNAPSAVGASRGGRVVMLVFDDLSLRPGDGEGLVAAAERTLRSWAPGDLIGLTTTSGFGPVVMPTRDRAVLDGAFRDRALTGQQSIQEAGQFFLTVREAIEIARGQPRETFTAVVARECSSDAAGGSAGASGGRALPMVAVLQPTLSGDSCSVQVASAARRMATNVRNRVAQQVAAFKRTIEALGTAPAPRIMVVLSGGLALHAGDDAVDQLEVISRVAAEHGVHVFALVEQSDISLTDRSPAHARARSEDASFLSSGAQTIAAAAGGESFKVVGQADRFVTRVAGTMTGVYRLGVEAPNTTGGERYLSVDVAVSRRSTTVVAPRYAVLRSTDRPSVSVTEALGLRLAQGGTAYGVPLRLATGFRRDGNPGDVQLIMDVDVPPVVAPPLTAMFAVIGRSGQTVEQGQASLSATSQGGYHLTLPVPLPVGGYTVRVAVADANANVGSVEREVNAGLHRFAAMTVSDVLAGWVDGNLRVALELYPDDAGAAPGVTVRLGLLNADTGAVVVDGEIVPARGESMFTVSATLPGSALAPGTYTLRAIVLDNGRVLGTVSRSIRKTP
jgi:VWFA-related protein